MKSRNAQFLAALGAYAAFAMLALTTLDGKIRLAVLILMGALALMTWLVWWRERHSSDDDDLG